MIDSVFNDIFKPVDPDCCKIGINGQIAVKAGEGKYKTYNVKTGRLTNVTQFCFDGSQGMFFVVPTTKASVGDILMIDGKPKCVIENKEGKTIRVIDYESSSIQEIVPERHIFMGQAYFYSKIVSMLGSGNFLKSSKGVNKMMKLMFMNQMFGGKGMGSMFGGSGNGGMNNMMQLVAMSSIFGGNGNSEFGGLFDEMFDISFDDVAFDLDEDGEEKIELTEEEKQAILAARAKKAKKPAKDAE